MKNRVVITGLGVVAPNAVGIPDFLNAIKNGGSGISFFEQLKELNFSCQIGGIPFISEEKKREYFSELQLKGFNSSGILYGTIAGMDALKDAGISPATDEPLWDLGIQFGCGASGVEKFREAIYHVDDGNVRRLGSTAVSQTMASGISAYLGGFSGAGNRVGSNSSACATGTEAVLLGYERIAEGKATQMLCGSTSDGGPYIWGAFDAIKVLPYQFNENPTRASRPMSASAKGFVPGSGAGALVLESLESAKNRGAKIYAEVLGGAANSGGQRAGGSMTAPNNVGVQKCILEAIENSGIQTVDIEYINGHLTATGKDPAEIENWAKALGRDGDDFPIVNSTKGTIGHCLAASGSIETVAAVLQLYHGFIAPNVNCEDLHPEIKKRVSEKSIPRELIHTEFNIMAKASFGFGDVNTCLIFKKI